MSDVQQTEMVKTCGVCKEVKLLGEFSRKGAGYRSKCKACQRAYSAAHYIANREAAIKRVRARDNELDALHRAMVNEVKAGACCGRCGSTKDLVTNTVGGARGLSNLISNGVSTAVLEQALANVRWSCRACEGHDVGSANYENVPSRAKVTLRSCVLAAVTGQMATDEIIKVVQARRAFSDQEIRAELLNLAAAKRLVRAGRGKYAPAP